jgi:hypothetical protein
MVNREVDSKLSQRAPGGPSPLASRLARFRLIPPLETYPWLVEFVQEPAGKVALLTVFALALQRVSSMWALLALVLGFIAFLPQYRRILVTVGTLLALVFYNDWIKWPLLTEIADRANLPGAISARFKATSILLFLGFCALSWHLIMRYKNSLVARQPVRFLLLLYALAFLSACAATPGRVRLWLWCFTVLLGGYFWALCYSFTDRNAKGRDGLLLQLGTYHPFWIGAVPTVTPLAKGSLYLRNIEAKSATEFAVTQLKGLKLLLWALILAAVLDVFGYVVYGQQGVLSGPLRITAHFSLPRFADALANSAAGARYPWYICWVSVIADFASTALDFSVMGHLVIACCRMAGFRAARNTCRPLQARNIADFWNRYLFYFKEVMVDFFFFPTYMRYFKRHPRLRMLAATFAAAGLGNMIYHLMRWVEPAAEVGLWQYVVGFQSYAFYTLVLSAGIGFSQLRDIHGKKSGPETWFRARVFTPASVLLFYCVLHIFDYTAVTHPLSERFVFLMNMFGLHV